MYRCDNCGSKDTYVKKYHHKLSVKGFEVEFDSDTRFCSNCDNFVYDSELDNDTIHKAFRIYNENYGIPGEDIRKFRKEFGLSVQDLASIIGCAKKTLISYENEKSVPNDVYLITLKMLIENPDIIKFMVDSNRERFDTRVYKRISDKVNKYLSNNFDNLFGFKNTKPSKYNGYTNMDSKKIINLIKILCENGIHKTKLLKELFYVDFLTYKNFGYSLTGFEYAKLPFGPVPDGYASILEVLVDKGIIKDNVKYMGDLEEHIICSIAPVDLDNFSNSEIEIINKVINKFKDYKTNDIVSYSHKEKAFIDTKYNKKISYDYAFDLNDL